VPQALYVDGVVGLEKGYCVSPNCLASIIGARMPSDVFDVLGGGVVNPMQILERRHGEADCAAMYRSRIVDTVTFEAQ